MGAVLLPQKFLAQPQYSPQVSEAYRDAQILSLFGSGSTKNLVGDNDLIAGAGGLPTRILNQQGYALKFNPGDLITEQVITIPSSLPGLTVFAWVRPNVLNESYRRIIETSYVDGFYLGTDSAGGNYLFTTNGASLSACVGGQQVVGQRDFVCGTWDGTNRVLYVNGEQVASSTSTKPSANRKMTVGSNASGGESWLGDIDTVGVFFRAFPASEVWSLYQDPWQLVRPQPRRIFVSASAEGSTGTLAYTNADDSVSASGATTVVGSTATTDANDTSAASGSTTVTGSSSTTNSGDNVEASGSPVVNGSLSTASANDTCAASGSAGSSVTGSVGYTDADDAVSATGTTTVTGSLSQTNANDTSASSGTTTVTSSLATTNADDTVSASGVAGSVTGTVAYANSDDACVATGESGASFSGGYLGTYRSQKERNEYKKKKRIEFGVIEAEKATQPITPLESNLVELHLIKTKRPIPARRQKKIDVLAEREALNAELKKLIQLEIDREEEIIVRMLMEM